MVRMRVCEYVSVCASRQLQEQTVAAGIASLPPPRLTSLALTKSHRDATFAPCAEEQREEAVVKGRVRLG